MGHSLQNQNNLNWKEPGFVAVYVVFFCFPAIETIIFGDDVLLCFAHFWDVCFACFSRCLNMKQLLSIKPSTRNRAKKTVRKILKCSSTPLVPWLLEGETAADYILLGTI